MGFVAGWLGVLLIALGALTPAISSTNSLQTFETHQVVYNVTAATLAVFAATSTVLICVVAGLFRQASGRLALASAILASLGLAVTTIGLAVFTSILGGITSGVGAPSAADAQFQASLAADLATSLAVVGGLLTGVGLLVLGAVGWRSGLIADWLSAVATGGGAAGLVVFVLPNLILVTVGAISILGFMVGISVASSHEAGERTETAGRGPTRGESPARSSEVSVGTLTLRVRAVVTQLRAGSASPDDARKSTTHLSAALELLRTGRSREAEGHIRLAESYAGLRSAS